MHPDSDRFVSPRLATELTARRDILEGALGVTQDRVQEFQPPDPTSWGSREWRARAGHLEFLRLGSSEDVRYRQQLAGTLCPSMK